MDFFGAALGISTCITTLRQTTVNRKVFDTSLKRKMVWLSCYGHNSYVALEKYYLLKVLIVICPNLKQRNGMAFLL